jgi:hypothetical protein
MNEYGTAGGWHRSSVAERGEWDAAVQRLGGSVLQSWAWGEWYRHGGFEVERVRVDGPHGAGLAQVLIWSHGPAAEARLARGPVLSGDRAGAAQALFAAVDKVCERHRPLTLTVEPPGPVPLTGTAEAEFVLGAERWCCPGRTVEVHLLDDQTLLRRMRKKTRHQVRRPERRGVTVDQVAPDTGGS